MATLAEQWEERGILKGIQDGLSVRFGPSGLHCIPEIQKIRGVERLREVLKAVFLAPSLEDFQKKLQSL